MSRKKERKNVSLYRKRGKPREPYDVVLIVCEGSKTEPTYFKALKNELRLSNANIDICGKGCGPAPKSVVEFALQKHKERGDYDRIFCVFDKDQHETYQTALDKIKSLPRKIKIEAITSVPCFEFWILLHFENTVRPYEAMGNSSICDQVVRDLRRHIREYEKGMKDVFDRTYPYVDEATSRAALRESRCNEDGTDNPSTKVHRLVSYMRNIKQKGRDT